MTHKGFLRRRLKWLLLAAPLILAVAIGAYLAFPRPLPPPTMDNMNPVETERVSLMLPKNWTQVSNLSTIKPVLNSAVGDAPNFAEFFDYAATYVDLAYVNFLRIQGIFIFIENVSLDEDAQRTRLNELWLNANMVATETGKITVPAGEMLHMKLTSHNEEVDGKAVVYSISQDSNWYVIGFLARNENAMTDLQPTIDAIVYSFTIK